MGCINGFQVWYKLEKLGLPARQFITVSADESLIHPVGTRSINKPFREKTFKRFLTNEGLIT